jgi:hypothetical protein
MKQTVKSARKSVNSLAGISEVLQKGENKRPESGSSSLKAQPASSGYRKIKRTKGGNGQECELIY